MRCIVGYIWIRFLAEKYKVVGLDCSNGCFPSGSSPGKILYDTVEQITTNTGYGWYPFLGFTGTNPNLVPQSGDLIYVEEKNYSDYYGKSILNRKVFT